MNDAEAIVITGSGSGIGAATARRLARPGVSILVHAKENEAGVAAVRSELEALGCRTEGLCLDLAEQDAAAKSSQRRAGASGASIS